MSLSLSSAGLFLAAAVELALAGLFLFFGAAAFFFSPTEEVLAATASQSGSLRGLFVLPALLVESPFDVLPPTEVSLLTLLLESAGFLSEMSVVVECELLDSDVSLFTDFESVVLSASLLSDFLPPLAGGAAASVVIEVGSQKSSSNKSSVSFFGADDFEVTIDCGACSLDNVPLPDFSLLLQNNHCTFNKCTPSRITPIGTVSILTSTCLTVPNFHP